jgi:hypothetical protein
MREEYMVHGLLLNLQGKRKLMLLNVKRLGDDYVPGINSIFVTHNQELLLF